MISALTLTMALAGGVMLSPLHAQEPPNGLWIAPGVIANAGDGRVFLMSPEGLVEAIDMVSGNVVWRSTDAAKPIALRGENIIAQTESVSAPSQLILTSLDKNTGAVRGQNSFDLGSGVDTSIDDGLGRSFLVDTGGVNSTDTDLYWRYFQQDVRARPGPPPPVFERFGSLNVDVDASAVTSGGAGFSRSSGRPPYAKPRVWRVQSESPSETTPIIDMESGQRFRLDGTPVDIGPTGVGTGDGVVAGDGTGTVVAPTPTGGLIITEGRPGDEFPPTRRLPGDQFGHSSDERHILSSSFAGRIEATEPYRWRIYERRTFNIAADFMARTSLAPFVAARNRVVYVRQPYQLRVGGRMQTFPLAVVARDASSGEVVWSRALRDTRYDGPIPH